MKSLASVFFISCLVLASNISFGQSGYMDNALNYSRLIKEKTAEGSYKLIGPFKVVGTSYLFGEKNKGNLFSPGVNAFNIQLNYNTYNQEIEFFSTANPDKPLVKEPGTVDSFTLLTNVSLGINQPLKFVYGAQLGSSEKAFFMELYAGPRFSIYKRYKSDLGYVSTNYIQPELRQFDLLYDYFYSDSAKQGLKRLKPNSSSIIKEFKSIKDISSVFNNDDFTINQEEALRKAFEFLNRSRSF